MAECLLFRTDREGAGHFSGSFYHACPIPHPLTQPHSPWNKLSHPSAPAQGERHSSRVTTRSKGPHTSPKPLLMNLTDRGGGQAKGQMTHLIFPGQGDKSGDGPQAIRLGVPHPLLCLKLTAPSPGQKPSLTLRTDTRKVQGSSRPVAGLALILHTKVNLFRHRTQFSCTSSLQARQDREAQAHRSRPRKPMSGTALTSREAREVGGGALAFHFVSQSDYFHNKKVLA